ncbi:SDR family NAD(P)-dependent oxidoreductase [Bacillus benzoevorans]|uniref:NAD(P)-dependent dehydrogenase (Short-subunit alcohol dehydrogenase family) n=1 Tax=Bacillus benzoevorans TaxID=1456 RepID=A0A7X0HT14_9BACI|nr:SDR family oxidoreductase [Bacillus benzoevorans]MBB6446319.1 NAD(P)-dependent dehydrogenase (short-subunit alcohol dehydrogenase family) [Bacillus benzoevorans]
MGRVDGKVAVITGGAAGLGKATAERLLKEGAKVVIVDLFEESLEKAKKELSSFGEVLSVQADVSKEEDTEKYVKAAVDTFGRIDIFFNNAGIVGKISKAVDLMAEDFDKVIAVNVRGVYLGMKHVLKVMEKQGSGSVINTSSIDGLGGGPLRLAYCASKHAVVGMTKTAALEVADKGIRVNSIHPSYAKTDMMNTVEIGVNAENPEEVRKQLAATIPLGRYGEPEDIANLVLFLGSDESAFITGTQQRIDGGMGAR